MCGRRALFLLPRPRGPRSKTFPKMLNASEVDLTELCVVLLAVYSPVLRQTTLARANPRPRACCWLRIVKRAADGDGGGPLIDASTPPLPSTRFERTFCQKHTLYLLVLQMLYRLQDEHKSMNYLLFEKITICRMFSPRNCKQRSTRIDSGRTIIKQ